MHKGLKMEPISLILSMALSFFLGAVSLSPKSNADIAELNKERIYKVQIKDVTIATAFALKTHKGVYLVTAAHVCDPLIELNGRFEVSALNHKNEKIKLTQFKNSELGDLCIMDKLPDSASKFKLSRVEWKAEDAWTLGFPLNRGLSVTSGMVVGQSEPTIPMERPLDKCKGEAFKIMEGVCVLNAKTTDTTIPAAPGNSGGPVINDRNEVIGVASYTDARSPGYLSIVPLEVIQKEVDKL